MGNKGTDFEKIIQPFLGSVLEEAGFVVVHSRIQKSGTQNGHDIRINFLDSYDTEHCFCFECKNYKTQLEFGEISKKLWELEASNYTIHGFIAISPHINISNIDDNIIANIEGKFKFPVRLWTPNDMIEELFSLDNDTYQKVYERPCLIIKNRDTLLRKFKAKIDNLIAERNILNISNKIIIPDTTELPKENEDYITSLDKKLNAVLDDGDEDRIEYHQLRCQYKIYIESLQDIDNVLRNDIITWQKNLRLKAKRLTKNFQGDISYKPQTFFHDFFREAERDLEKFLERKNLTGDTEKLLNGIIFELAAECPLDWRKNHG